MQTSISSKGQIVIPSAVRPRFGLREGTRFAVHVDENAHRIILTPITSTYIESQRGRFRGRAPLKALATEKKRERKA